MYFDLICISHLLQVDMKRDSTHLNHFSLGQKSFQKYFPLGDSIMSNVADVRGFEFWWKKLIFRRVKMGRWVGEQRRRDHNYLSLMLHRSMCKSLKFPREPCWTEMRSLGWLSIKMSLMQPWKALMGCKHWESVRLSGHPVGQRKKNKEEYWNDQLLLWRPIDRRL